MTTMPIKAAEQALDAAFAEARRQAMKPLGVAVLDAGGHLVAFKREDGATMIRYDVAVAKAWTALALGAGSRGFQEMAEARPHFANSLGAITGGRMAPAAGGVLLLREGQVIGAVGVSGDTPDNDELAAAAGAAAL